MDIATISLNMRFVIAMCMSILYGYVIGLERESRGKDAGIGTHILVIAGSALFTLLSSEVDPASKSRIAAQIVTGIGFLGAGLILKDKSSKVLNLTTASSIWFSGAIGMAIGFDFYFIALVASLLCAFVPRLHKNILR